MSNFGILGATCFGSFECESCGIKKVHVKSDLVEGFVDTTIERVLFKFLFDCDQRSHRIFSGLSYKGAATASTGPKEPLFGRAWSCA